MQLNTSAFQIQKSLIVLVFINYFKCVLKHVSVFEFCNLLLKHLINLTKTFI